MWECGRVEFDLLYVVRSLPFLTSPSLCFNFKLSLADEARLLDIQVNGLTAKVFERFLFRQHRSLDRLP